MARARRACAFALAAFVNVLAIGACGDLRVSLGEGVLDSATDVAPDGDARDAPDAEIDTGPVVKQCPHGAPFVSVKPVLGFEGTDVWSARLSPDENTIYVSIPEVAGTATKFDLYSAGRMSNDVPFGVPAKLSISSTTDDYWPTVSPNGQVMFFESGIRPDGGEGTSRIWFASRTTVPGNFSSTLLDYFASVPESVTEAVPYLLPGGKRLYWSSIGREGRTSLDIWAAGVTAAGAVTTPIKLENINTTEDDSYPVVTDDDRELFFGHNLGVVLDDIYVTVRADESEAFPPPALVAGPINTPDDAEWSSWVSTDSCRLYFIRRKLSADEARLFVAERAKP